MKKIMQVKDYLLELAFIALLIRVVAVGCGIGEALALISIVSSIGYNKYLAKTKITEREEIETKFNESLEQLSKDLKDTQAKVNSLSLNSGVRRAVNEQETATGLVAPKRRF